MSQQRFIPDCAQALNVTEEVVFLRAIRAQKGFDSPHFYVGDFALDVLSQTRLKMLNRAKRTRELKIAGIDVPLDMPGQALISELCDQDDGA